MKIAQGLIIGLALSITAAPALAGGQEAAAPPPPAETPPPPARPLPALGPDEGRVVLNCAVQRDGSVTDCLIEEEEPAGVGFGPAALRVAAQSRLAPDETRALGADAPRARWTTRFRLED